MKQSFMKVASVLAVLTVGGVALAVTLTQRVVQKNLVSSPDFSPPAPNTDRNLVNPWGIVFVNDLLLVANNGTGTSTFYDEDGRPFPRNNPVVINVNGHNTRNADPTGLALNPDGGFLVSKGFVTRPATLVYANEDGTIAAWNFAVDPNDALVVVDTNNTDEPALYKGLTFAIDGGRQPFLFVADFGAPGVNDGTGKVDVYNRAFRKVAEIPLINLPPLPDTAPRGAVFTAFNVANVDNLLFVTLAVKEPGETDEAHCVDCGAVQVYTTTGHLLTTITSPTASGEHIFNAPWGVSRAPFIFGRFSNQILIGNFGDGTLNAFSRNFPFRFLGRITDRNNNPLVIEGLWGIDRGNTFGQLDDLFFASGPAQGGEEESKGLVGELDPLP